MDPSRREFFKAFAPKVTQVKSESRNLSPLTLGHLAVFPVHSLTKIKLFEDEFIVESLPEGIRLKNILTDQNFKLSLNSHGLVQAHLNEPWPASAVLSIFTGEIYNI